MSGHSRFGMGERLFVQDDRLIEKSNIFNASLSASHGCLVCYRQVDIIG